MEKLTEEFKQNVGEFREYKLKDIFKSANGDFDIQKKHLENKGEFVVSSGLQNLGIIGKSQIKAKIFKPDTITIDMFGNTFYRDFSYKMVTHARVFSLSSDILKNSKIGLYLSGKLKYLNKIFAYDNMASWQKIQNFGIKLPTINNQIAFDFMERYISELEEERISELTAYLKVSGLEDYTLTEEEQNAIDLLRRGKVKFKQFKIGDLFEISTPIKKFNANSVNFGGKYPYVVRTSQNNGIRDYLDEDEKYLNPANTISFGQDTATIFYQEKPYFTGDKIKIMNFKTHQLESKLACFLLAIMNKSFSSFQWGQSSFNVEVLKNVKILLPINNDTIDYPFMQVYIKAIEKLVIKNVVDWRDKVINKTKEVIS